MTKEAVVLLVEDNIMDIELTLDAFHQAKLVNNIQVMQKIDDYWLTLNINSLVE